jgi:hypothetical protein
MIDMSGIKIDKDEFTSASQRTASERIDDSIAETMRAPKSDDDSNPWKYGD